jgi:hypothetical protein
MSDIVERLHKAITQINEKDAEIERLTAARDAAMRVHMEDGAEIERLRDIHFQAEDRLNTQEAEIERLRAEHESYVEWTQANLGPNDEIERLRAERNLWRERAERMFWLLPDDVRLSEIQVNSALEAK